MKKTFTLTSVALAFLLAGCISAPYKAYSHSTRMGYSSKKISEDRFEVVFKGNENTSKRMAYDFALLRAAELAQELNCERFAILSESDRTVTRTTNSPGFPAKQQRTVPIVRDIPNGGPTIINQTVPVAIPASPGSTMTFRMPGHSFVIQVLRKGDYSEAPATKTYSADEVIHEVRTKYRMPLTK